MLCELHLNDKGTSKRRDGSMPPKAVERAFKVTTEK